MKQLEFKGFRVHLRQQAKCFTIRLIGSGNVYSGTGHDLESVVRSARQWYDGFTALQGGKV